MEDTQHTGTARRTQRALATVVGVLVAYNLVGNLVIPGWGYVPTNLAVAATLLVLARRSGLRWDELGLAASRTRSGLVYGGITALLVVAVLAVGALLPSSRELYEDDRVAVGLGGFLFQVLVSIPLGTVVLEELAFRGVLLALLMRRFAPLAAITISSALFGLWHVVPTMPAASGNQVVTDAATGPGLVLVVAGAVVATTIGGFVFSWLRLRSGSLLAPMLAHLSTNSGSYTIAWLLGGGT